uniref:Ig-like domain-containing protein n=1 Tax=Tetraodon nigroviridis TaxID=99883 RepID=H3D8W3_TETNG
LSKLMEKPTIFAICSVCLCPGEARVNTETPAGPLYRVVGSLLSISCNTSGFINEHTDKEFQFRIMMPGKRNEINIISTHDKFFSYAVYSQRVRDQEVTLTHVTPNSAVFKIQSLQKSDEGEFECSVANPESVYDGTYSAKTTVKVIDDSLTVSSPGPTSPSYDEGDALTLTCRASSNTVQHTHLSLTWYLQRRDEDNPRPIISLDRDLTLIPGQGFERRYQDGLIRLDKVGEGTYKLQFAKLEQSDQGEIYCQAQEWIQDPDGSWYSISQKEAEKKTVSVQTRATEVPPTTSSLVEGQKLSLSCSLSTQNLEEKFFTVAWFRGSVELVSIGPSGILTVGSEYSARANDGELRAARRGVRDYSLVLQPVSTEDQGEYLCRAWPQVRGQDGGFTQGAAHSSDPESIKISASEGVFSLEMQNAVTVKEGDSLSFTCKVNGAQGQLSVTWQRKATSGAVFTTVISQNQDGVTEEGPEFASRLVRAARPATDTFTLELDKVTPSDAGVYLCVVSAWKTNSKISSHTKESTVTVAPTVCSSVLESFLKLRLIGRKNRVTVGETVELICQNEIYHKMPPSNQVAVIVVNPGQLRKEDENKTIVSLDQDALVTFGPQLEPISRQRIGIMRFEGPAFELIIRHAQISDGGSYICKVVEWLQGPQSHWYPLPPSSTTIMLTVTEPGMLNYTSADTSENEGEDVELQCDIVSKASSPSHFYKVSWLYTGSNHSSMHVLVQLDHTGLLSYPEHPGLRGLQQRLRLSRPAQMSSHLQIEKAQNEDSGMYNCQIELFQLDRGGQWQQKASESSSPIRLTV